MFSKSFPSFFFFLPILLHSHLSPFQATIFPFCWYLLSCSRRSFTPIQKNYKVVPNPLAPYSYLRETTPPRMMTKVKNVSKFKTLLQFVLQWRYKKGLDFWIANFFNNKSIVEFDNNNKSSTNVLNNVEFLQ